MINVWIDEIALWPANGTWHSPTMNQKREIFLLTKNDGVALFRAHSVASGRLSIQELNPSILEHE